MNTFWVISRDDSRFLIKKCYFGNVIEWNLSMTIGRELGQSIYHVTTYHVMRGQSTWIAGCPPQTKLRIEAVANGHGIPKTMAGLRGGSLFYC